jgi:hypothetical protein
MTAGPGIPETASKFKLEDTPMLSATILSAMKTRRAAILSNLLLTLPLAAGLFCSASNASAQTSLDFNVPFTFSAAHQQLPVGSYRVQLMSGCYMLIRNIKTARTIVVMIRPEQGRYLESHSRLVFDRYGSQNYLTQVWTPNTNRYSKLTAAPKFHEELAKQVHPAVSTIEVASK